MAAPRLKHRLEFAAFRAAIAGGRRISEARAVAIGEAAGRTAYRLGIRRDIVDQNLRVAFPDADEEWISHTGAAASAWLGRETMMTLRLSWTSPEEVIERTRPVNVDKPIADFHAGRGLIVVAGHLGNWEIGAATMAVRGYPVVAIAKRAANPLFYQKILAARARLGVGVIDFMRATRPTLQALREGKAVAFAADQHAGSAGIWVPFFGRLASTFRGPALMALRTGAPMYLAHSLRMPDGVYELRFDAMHVRDTGDLEADVEWLTRSWVARLEAAVRAYPGQYLWHHRRWRQPPPGIEEPQGVAEV
jgi:Kdo2-lipid IVA lauroyltransferase/acyltransferase